jgi:dethiobiotin synthetase
MAHYFITGTDTDAGKTYVTCLLLESLRRAGRSVAGYKPFVCGPRTDAHQLLDSSSPGLMLEEVNPVWLKSSAAPYAAGLLENKPVSIDVARAGFHHLAARFEDVLIEGAGGWEVPLTESETLADFAQSLGVPVLLVVNNRLGALNHTILTVRNIHARGLMCAGVILNHVGEERDAASISNRMVLERFLEVPILAEVMHGETEMDWPLESVGGKD